MPRIAERPNPEFYTSSAALPSPNPQLLPEVSANPVALVLQPQAFFPSRPFMYYFTNFYLLQNCLGGVYLKCRFPEFTLKDSDYRSLGWGPGLCILSKP